LILILDHTETEFSKNLRSVFDRRGEKTLLLTCEDIVRDTSTAFYLGAQKADFRVQYKDHDFHASDIKGIYCGINAFTPYHFPHFSAEDASFAAMETQAFWLALLASLTCRDVNPPALDALAGTYLSPAEFLFLAHSIGFHIPMVAYLESGASAAEVYKAGVPARYSDLGKPWVEEINHDQVNIRLMSENGDHFMVQENPAGTSVWVTIIGKQLVACELNASGTIIETLKEQLPKLIRSRILKLNNILNLHVAEYIFKLRQDGQWYLCGVTRPPQISIIAYGERIYHEIADYILGLGE